MTARFSICIAALFFAVLHCERVTAAPLPPQPGTKVIQKPFRVRFQSYEGDRSKPETMVFQVATLDLRQPLSKLKLGETIPNTNLKLTGFKYRLISGPNFHEEDVSELTIINTETNKTVVAPKWRIVDFPTWHHVTPSLGK